MVDGVSEDGDSWWLSSHCNPSALDLSPSAVNTRRWNFTSYVSLGCHILSQSTTEDVMAVTRSPEKEVKMWGEGKDQEMGGEAKVLPQALLCLPSFPSTMMGFPNSEAAPSSCGPQTSAKIQLVFSKKLSSQARVDSPCALESGLAAQKQLEHSQLSILFL